MKYLPDQYKDAAKAKAGAEGGKATRQLYPDAEEFMAFELEDFV
jgi:hypothetical protein